MKKREYKVAMSTNITLRGLIDRFEQYHWACHLQILNAVVDSIYITYQSIGFSIVDYNFINNKNKSKLIYLLFITYYFQFAINNIHSQISTR